jgi:hypothetical protein
MLEGYLISQGLMRKVVNMRIPMRVSMDLPPRADEAVSESLLLVEPPHSDGCGYHTET